MFGGNGGVQAHENDCVRFKEEHASAVELATILQNTEKIMNILTVRTLNNGLMLTVLKQVTKC